jgi:L,D-peptidoglycan transpeptidase YkuD (ErfK/YbiS/YcfS/YnhG family)
MRVLLGACAVVLGAAPAARAADEVTPAGMRGLDGATRVVVVSASRLHTTRATARTYERAGGGWRRVRGAMPARLGYRGLRSQARRREGDRTTPIGSFGFVYGFGSRPDPGVQGLGWRRLTPGSCWSGAQADYNRWVRGRSCGPGDEDLWASAPLAYRYAAVIDFNSRRPVYGRGSGIFLHVQTGRPTHGCVSLRQRDLLSVLRWLRPDTRIVIGTAGWLRARKR